MAINQNKHTETIVKRSGRKHDHEGHSSAWKVAFADFCLALMCLFLVMWVMAARDEERIKQVVLDAAPGTLHAESRGRIADMSGAPRGSLIERHAMAQGQGASGGPDRGQRKMQVESPAQLRELAQTLVRLTEKAGLAGNLQTVVTPYGLRVMLHDTDKQGIFERGSAVPNERFRQLLLKMGRLFGQIDNQMLVVGHTDALPYADTGHPVLSNWALSSNRGLAARTHLLAGGMAGSSVLQVVGMAERAPIDSGDPLAAVNRRVELLILTAEQARTLAAMFGAPERSMPLIDGVHTAASARADALRGALAASSAGGLRE